MKLKKLLAALACMTLTLSMTGKAVSNAAETSVLGDVNADTVCSVADLVMMNRYILGAGELTDYSNGDMNGDGIVDIFDMNAMRSDIISSSSGFSLPDISILKNLTEDYEKDEIPEKKADRRFILGQTDFSLSLFQNLVSDDENVCVSPYSVMQALAMTANGADGKTKEEMENVLGGISIEELNEYLYTQRNKLLNSEYGTVRIANSIWTINDPSRIVVYPEFLQNTKNYYDSEVFRAPFDNTTIKDINDWVSQKTDKMIPSAIDKINEEDVMFLINTILFDGEWQTEYQEYNVVDGQFTASDGKVQDAEFMLGIEYKYIKDENAQGFVKDFKYGKYSFAAILPDEDISVSEYVNSLTPEGFNKMLNNASSETVITSMPKFSFDYNTDLIKVLDNMGMDTAFDDRADFSRMGKTNTGMLYIGTAIHKTRIEVTEKGTKAAAVTVIGMAAGSEYNPEPPKEVILDRPFVFAIIDNDTSLPLFIGTLNSLEN